MLAARRVLDWIVNALMVVSGISIVLMMLVVVADAFARAAFNSTFPGAEEFTSNYFMVAVTFLPLAFVQRVRGHVIIELFTAKLSARATAGLDSVVHFVCAVGSLIFCWAAYGKALAMTQDGEYAIGTVLVTIWPTRWMLVVGMFVLALYLLLQAVEDARKALGLGQPDTTNGDDQAAALL